ncbi:uncharacterized protein [Panulirus ornatus]|uniref:uncharacterized protein n=1 Tax=Panulirus ornatus TaxID=150431 RepID=UPI003A88553F
MDFLGDNKCSATSLAAPRLVSTTRHLVGMILIRSKIVRDPHRLGPYHHKLLSSTKRGLPSGSDVETLCGGGEREGVRVARARARRQERAGISTPSTRKHHHSSCLPKTIMRLSASILWLWQRLDDPSM